MKLEDEIQQVAKFKDSYQKLVVNLIYSSSWVSALVRQRLTQYNLSMQQYNILRILRGQYPNPATMSLVSERMLDKCSDTSRIIDRMVRKRLVTRRTSSQDARRVDIRITEAGLEVLRTLDPIITPYEVLAPNLTIEEATLLNELLDKMRG